MMQLEAFDFFLLAFVPRRSTRASVGCVASRLHDLVDSQLGVSCEPSGSYFSRNPESVDEGLVLGDVIGGVEVKTNHVAEFVSLR